MERTIRGSMEVVSIDRHALGEVSGRLSSCQAFGNARYHFRERLMFDVALGGLRCHTAALRGWKPGWPLDDMGRGCFGFGEKEIE
jgi:hypothetical protein